MNPLNCIVATIASGFILAIIISAVYMGMAFNLTALIIWLHVLFGIVWIGLLYYFNFVQVPAVAEATSSGDPGPAAINKYAAPRALIWFRHSAWLTWLTGAAALETIYRSAGGLLGAFTFSPGLETIGIGAWLGTIMLFNVWVFIWPNQKKILGLHGATATDEQKATAKKVALIASRTNTLLSIPMIMSMVSMGHGFPI